MLAWRPSIFAAYITLTGRWIRHGLGRSTKRNIGVGGGDKLFSSIANPTMRQAFGRADSLVVDLFTCHSQRAGLNQPEVLR